MCIGMYNKYGLDSKYFMFNTSSFYFYLYFYSKRSIPSTSIILHTAHCARFLEQCQKCKELVPKAEMLIHIEEYHSLKVCDICDASIEGKIEGDQHKVINTIQSNSWK